MPLLKIQTNLTISSDQQQMLIRAASQQVANLLGKPEQYVMVSLEHSAAMLFAGTDAPLAYLELKSIGLPTAKTSAFSKSLCELIHQTLGIDTDRIYIEFTDAERTHWGWNGGTF